ncbi:MAG TPA: transporter substrate-binding domain-containing protein [Kiritimatiellia bacterium]|nr:transporter substrate-binding domain-containing protein [Kiritimatiellia bacterium]HMO98207.1 transporter substrate-binding domain-containing protein [Kiritimatiellia bacterium]HMP96475.1 transporter substrate-binding domain-containing protein [Kiritimatiellia bacterium]
MIKLRGIAGLIVLSVLAGCATPEPPRPPPAAEPPPLRVGIAPNTPPLAFMQQGELAGVEIEFMRRLGRDLGRPVSADILPFEELIDALLAGQLDVIMSGLSVTEARKMRVVFTEPWLRTGLLAMMRHRDAEAVASVEAIRDFRGRIGVIPGTTGHDYVRRHCRQAKVVRIASPGDAAVQLQRNVIDLFIHDLPSVLWQVSAHEAELTALMERLSHENIAWAVRSDQTALRDQLNAALDRWRQDGSLDAAIGKWIPYFDSLR